MLKLHIDSLDDVSENAREFYQEKEDGSGYSLQLATKVVAEDRFNREVNRLQKKIDSSEERKDWVSPEDHQKLVDEVTQLKDTSNLDDLVNQRVQDRLTEWENEKTSLTQERDSFKNNYQNTLLETEVQKVAAAAGVKSAALPDVLLRAKTMFQIADDGKFVAKAADGKELFDKDAVTPLSVQSWVSTMTKDAPHWFEESKGGGATGNTTKTVVNNQPKSSVDLYAQGLKGLE